MVVQGELVEAEAARCLFVVVELVELRLLLWLGY